MIFVTVGSAEKGIEFNRLIIEMDKIAEKIEEEVIMQIGSIEYKPRNAFFFRYVNFSEALSYFQRASLIVGHAGTGTILNALQFRVPLILIPRRLKYGELDNDDHQIEIAKRLEGRVWIEVVYNIEELESKIFKMLNKKREIKWDNVLLERNKLISFLKNFIYKEFGKRIRCVE